MVKTENSFGEALKAAVDHRAASLREFAKVVGIDHGNLSRLCTGRRTCGLATAVRLADALNLFGWDRQEFMQKAAESAGPKRRSVGLGHADYPAVLRDATCELLRGQDVFPDDIMKAEKKSKSSGSFELTMLLRGGKTCVLKAELRVK